MLTLLSDTVQSKTALSGKLNAASGFRPIIALSENYDCRVMLVDDVTIAGVGVKEANKREEIAQQLVRFCTNTSYQAVQISKTNATTRRFAGGLLLTGETTISGASTNDRLIIVPVETDVTASGEERRLAATVFQEFIQWLLPRLDEYIGILRQRMEKQPHTGNLRLKQAAEMYLWIAEAFWEYAAEGTGSSEAWRSRQFEKSKDIIAELFDAQAELVNRISQQQPEGDLLFYLRKLYSDHEFKIKREANHWHSKNSALIKKSDFLVSPEYLLQVITDKTPLEFSTEKALGKALDKLNLLTAQEADKHTVKRHGERVYSINLNKIMDNRED